MRMKKVKVIIGIVVVLVVIIGVILLRSAGVQRYIKDVQSNYTGGLERIVKVYDYQGNVIQTYEGKIDIQEKSNTEVKFELNGKRYIIYNSPVIVEEK